MPGKAEKYSLARSGHSAGTSACGLRGVPFARRRHGGISGHDAGRSAIQRLRQIYRGIGGLAFALGIGAAVLTGQAVASADTGDSGAGNAGGTTSSSAPSHHPRTDAGPKARLSREVIRHRIEGGLGRRREVRQDVAAVAPSEPDAEEAAHDGEGRRHGDRYQPATDTDDAGSTTLTLTAPTPAPVSDADRDAPVNRFAGLVNLVTSSLVGNSGTKTTQTVDAAAASTVVASGLREPTDFQFLPDGRILVAEKGGRIRIVEDGVVSKRPVGRLPVLTQGERGLGGLAVDPDFATNGYIYVAYTTLGARDRLARLTVVGDKVAFGSQKLLLQSNGQIGVRPPRRRARVRARRHALLGRG